MKTYLCVSLLCVALTTCWAHMCLINPTQRGSMKMLNVHAASDCILLTSPCGGRPTDDIRMYLRAGQNFTVTFQKNADHWKSGSPGDFTVRFGLATPGHMMFDDLAVIPDAGEPSLTLYTKEIRIPDKARGQYVIQVDYRTNNQQAPAHFYQCADVFVI